MNECECKSSVLLFECDSMQINRCTYGCEQVTFSMSGEIVTVGKKFDHLQLFDVLSKAQTAIRSDMWKVSR